MEGFNFYNNKKTGKSAEILTRIVIFEKCKKHNFENKGLKYWYDKFGNTIRIDDDNSSLDITQFINIKKSTTNIEAGYIWAPYVPIQNTEVIFNEQNFTPSKNIQSRYAITQINNNYYGIITVA